MGAGRWRALLVTGSGAAFVDLALWAVTPRTFAALPAAFWVMGLLAVVVDARPYVVANRRASSVILPSICFTFAIALAWGLAPALAVQVAAVAVAGARMPEPRWAAAAGRGPGRDRPGNARTGAGRTDAGRTDAGRTDA
jgi:diguanylate cyclase